MFDRIMLCILLSLIPLRTVVNETVQFEVARMFRHIAGQGLANPGTTFLFGMVIAFVAVATWSRRLAAGEPRYRWTGGEIGLVLLIIAGVVSYCVAGQKHLALIGAVNLVTLVLYGMTLRQYLTSPWHVRLALVVILATATVVVAKCALQHFKEQPDTIEYWEENKAEILGEEGAAASGRAAGMRHDYEKRMLSRLVTGYYPHANVLGSHLVLFIMVAVALVVDRIRRGVSPLAMIAPTVIAAGCAMALFGTGSKGAIACVGLAMLVWLSGAVFARWISRNRSVVAATLWGCGLAGVVAVALVLRADEGALGRSMQFRHMYWRGATDMIVDGHWLGVGPLNFGRHFLRYKPVECPEEVASPHSWIVQLAAEWGLLGLFAFVVLVAGISWRLARPREGTSSVSERGPPESIVWWPIALMVVVFGFWLLQMLGADPQLIKMAMFVGATPWLAAAVLGALESAEDSVFSNAPCPGVLAPIVAGLIAFLLHTGIDLAVFEGGPATTFFAMIAIALAAAGLPSDNVQTSNSPVPRVRRRPGLGLAVVAASAILGIVGIKHFVIAPFAYQSLLQDARADTTRSDWRTYLVSGGGVAYANALDTYSLDGTAHVEFAEQLTRRVRTVAEADAAIEIVDEFARRDPNNGLRHNLRGTLLSQKYYMTKDDAFLREAVRELTAYVEEYPTSPLRHNYLAIALIPLARDHADDEARAAAIEHMEAALALDEQRIHVSKPNRFPPEQIAGLRAGIEALRALP